MPIGLAPSDWNVLSVTGEAMTLSLRPRRSSMVRTGRFAFRSVPNGPSSARSAASGASKRYGRLVTWISGYHFARYCGELTCICTAPDRNISTTSSILPSWPAGYSSTWIWPLLLASTSFLKSAMVSAVVSPSPWELPNLILSVLPACAVASGADRPISAAASTMPTAVAFVLMSSPPGSGSPARSHRAARLAAGRSARPEHQVREPQRDGRNIRDQEQGDQERGQERPHGADELDHRDVGDPQHQVHRQAVGRRHHPDRHVQHEDDREVDGIDVVGGHDLGEERGEDQHRGRDVDEEADDEEQDVEEQEHDPRALRESRHEVDERHADPEHRDHVAEDPGHGDDDENRRGVLQRRHDDAGDDAGEKQSTDAEVVDRGVDHEGDTGRDDRPHGGGGGHDRGGIVGRVAAPLHGGHEHGSERGGIADLRAGHPREDHLHDDDDLAETTRNPPHQDVGQVDQPGRDAAHGHQITGEEKERDGEKRPGVHRRRHLHVHDRERDLHEIEDDGRGQPHGEGDRNPEPSQTKGAGEEDGDQRRLAHSGSVTAGTTVGAALGRQRRAAFTTTWTIISALLTHRAPSKMKNGKPVAGLGRRRLSRKIGRPIDSTSRRNVASTRSPRMRSASWAGAGTAS